MRGIPSAYGSSRWAPGDETLSPQAMGSCPGCWLYWPAALLTHTLGLPSPRKPFMSFSVTPSSTQPAEPMAWSQDQTVTQILVVVQLLSRV